MTTTTRKNENQFFEVRFSIYAGSNERKAFDKDVLKTMGFNDLEFDAVKAVLNTDILPQKAFNPFLKIRKAVKSYITSVGYSHPMAGCVFSPDDRVEVVSFMKKKQKEYEDAKQKFLASYPKYLQAQLDKVVASAEMKGLDPEPLVKAVQRVQPSVEYYRRHMEFIFLDVSVEFDSEQWQDVIDRINSDLVERTAYELGKDSAYIRNVENAKSRARKLYELSDKLGSLGFYVPGLKSLSNSICASLELAGKIKPGKEYSQRESLLLSGIARVLEDNANGLVKSTASFEALMKQESVRVESLLDDDEEQIEVTDVTPVAPTKSTDEKDTVEEPVQEPSSEPVSQPEPQPQPVSQPVSQPQTFGTFSW